MRLPFGWGAAVAVVLVGVGCGGRIEAEPVGTASSTLIGSVAGSDAVVALVTDGAHVTFYLCGGPTSYVDLTRWFSGSVDGSALQASSTDQATLSGQVDGAGAHGTIVLPDGVTLAWTARPAVPDTDEGLYAAVDEGCRTGVVVMQASASADVQMQGTWCNSERARMQVTPVLPVLHEAGSIEVLVAARPLLVSPVSLP